MNTTTTTPTTDFTADYLAARIEREQATDLTVRGQAEAKAERIARAAERAGIDLDITKLVDEAFRTVFPVKKGGMYYRDAEGRKIYV